VPTASATSTITAPAEDLWQVICDPHHLPRWWPRVERVEDVDGDAFTEVMKTAKGKLVRADFKLVRLDEPGGVVVWAQQVENTPFARLLEHAETEIRLVSAPGAHADGGGWVASCTEVTIELRQELNTTANRPGYKRAGFGSYFRGFGNHMVRRAAQSTVEQALEGLQRISGA
jgi:uncharacterized protein YndB with AHSA1/START domain